MDHRWGMRVSVDFGVQLICRPRAIGVGRLVNVSVSGAFVRSGFIPELLTHIRLAGPLGRPAQEEWEEMEGFVVRRSHDGFGIEWAELAPAAVCVLIVASSRVRGRGVTAPQLICTRRDVPVAPLQGIRRNG